MSFDTAKRILIDLTHPAHLHFFRNFASRLESEGHLVKLTGRNKDIFVDLANVYNLDVEVFGTARRGLTNLAREMVYRQWRLLRIILNYRPHAIFAIAGTYVALPAKLCRIPTYIFSDTEHATISNRLAFPFATCTFIPQCYNRPVRWKHERYAGYHELAYLHPHYFTASKRVLTELGIEHNEVFSLLRFVSWGSGHDIGASGMTDEGKMRAVETLSRYGRVYITSEAPLPDALEPYQLSINVSRIHDLMAHAALVFGESATMASEGAVLGVPSIFIDPTGRGYTDEQQRKYGLVFNFRPTEQEQAIAKAEQILANNHRSTWQERRLRLLDDKIDVNELLYDLALGRHPSRHSNQRPADITPDT